MERLVCLLLGYCFGLFLTAELVARFRTGRGAAELGSGNPGMANIVGSLGAAWGALVLLGDVGKTAAACLLARFVLFPELGRWQYSTQVWEPLWDTIFPCGGGSAVEREWQ